MAYNVARYGWRPDLPDARDYIFQPPPQISLPPAIDLRSNCPVVYDQGGLGSCTANAIVGAEEYARKIQGLEDWTGSRLFLYYNERVYIHEQSQDAGAYIRDGMKSMKKQGIVPETEWPYDESKFAVKPGKKLYTEAKKFESLTYSKVTQTLVGLQTALAGGFPVIFGFTVYASFESQEVTDTGIVPMPGPGEDVLGGHAVCAVGYDTDKGWFICRNSWGDAWGDKGYFYMPFAYLTSRSLSSDLWVMTKIKQAVAA